MVVYKSVILRRFGFLTDRNSYFLPVTFCLSVVTSIRRAGRYVVQAGIIGAFGLAIPAMPSQGMSVVSCSQEGPYIAVRVQDVRTSDGLIVADLHGDDPKHFLKKGKRVSRIRVPAALDEVNFCIPVAGPGVYAIAVYHDVNGNRKFDKNWIGLPKEPFGVSNNPRVRLGPPKFKEAAFEVNEVGANVEIVLNNRKSKKRTK